MNLIKAALIVLAVILGFVAAFFVPIAKGNGTVSWTGHGSENVEGCAIGHWIFTGGGNHEIESARLFVDGSPYSMTTQSGRGAFHADAPIGQVVYVEYVGNLGNGRAILTLSHCVTEGTPTPTSTPPAPTGTPAPTVPPTATGTPAPTVPPTATPASTGTPAQPTGTPAQPTNTSTPPIGLPTGTPAPTVTGTPPIIRPPATGSGPEDRGIPGLSIAWLLVAAGLGLVFAGLRTVR